MGSCYCPEVALVGENAAMQNGTNALELPTVASGFTSLASMNLFRLYLDREHYTFPLYTSTSLKMQNKTTTINSNQMMMYLTDKRLWFTLESFKMLLLAETMFLSQLFEPHCGLSEPFRPCNTIFCKEGKKNEIFLLLAFVNPFLF